MIGKLLNTEEVNAALVLALSGAVTVLVVKGDEPLSLERVVAGVLSNPVPKGAGRSLRSPPPSWLHVVSRSPREAH